jgi:hypothetical protein
VARRPATIEVDEQLLEALGRVAADEGVAPDDLLDEALRRHFGLHELLSRTSSVSRVEDPN